MISESWLKYRIDEKPSIHHMKKNSTTSVFEYLFLEDNEQKFTFTMCNPPFYTSFQELWESRSPSGARAPPKNGFTGSPQELITEGGELQFCRRMIEESKNIQQQILIFSTMIGHKYNLKELILDLKAEGIKYTTTEFCQGRVTRWGLAWTYQDYDFAKLEVKKFTKVPNKSIPLLIILPEIGNTPHTLDNAIGKIKTILQNLKINYQKKYETNQKLTLDIVAETNTWSNQRLKRRMQKREESECKVPKLNDETTISIHSDFDASSSKDVNCTEATYSNSSNTSREAVQDKSKANQPILHATTKILKKNNEIHLEMQYLDGSAGKDGIHQILQYVKNNWK